MPGIVGLITKAPSQCAMQELRRMAATMEHEAFYRTVTYSEEVLGLYVALVERKDSSLGREPAVHQAHGAALIFSGEEFTHRANDHPEADPPLESECGQIAYLLNAYRNGKSFPAMLNGRFHGAVADNLYGKVLLFNDRYGIHRLYYHESREAFYFAAEAKAILAVHPELRSAEPRGLGELVSCGCVLENRTLFAGIHVLPPASIWSFQNASIQEKRSYFEPREWENQSPLSPERYYEKLREAFSKTLPQYFLGGKPIGASLTGGLDTRAIMAWHKSAPGTLPCYTFGGMFRECQDVAIGRQVAEACGQTHQVLSVGEEFLSNFCRYAERTVYLTDGCCGVDHSPDLYVNELARQIAPVRMTGNYGSEILRQMRAFRPVEPAHGLFCPEFLPYVRQAPETYQNLIQTHPVSFAAFRQAPWHHYGLLALEQTQLTLRSPFLDNYLVQTVYRAPVSVNSQDLCLKLIADGDPQLAKIPSDRGLLGKSNGWRQSVRQTYRTFTVKAEYAYDYGMPQTVAKVDRAFSFLHLERLFLGRNKFYHFRVWYRDCLSTYIRELLLDSRTLSRPYLNRSAVEAIVKGHARGDRNYTTEIHTLLTLELFHRLFVDSK